MTQKQLKEREQGVIKISIKVLNSKEEGWKLIWSYKSFHKTFNTAYKTAQPFLSFICPRRGGPTRAPIQQTTSHVFLFLTTLPPASLSRCFSPSRVPRKDKRRVFIPGDRLMQRKISAFHISREVSDLKSLLSSRPLPYEETSYVLVNLEFSSINQFVPWERRSVILSTWS